MYDSFRIRTTSLTEEQPASDAMMTLGTSITSKVFMNTALWDGRAYAAFQFWWIPALFPS